MRNPFSIGEYMRKRRVPVTRWQSAVPYVLSVDSFGSKPTRLEVRQIEFFLGYLLETFPMNGFTVAHRSDFDIAVTALWRTVILHKFGPGHWGYRTAHSWWSTYWPYIREVKMGDVPPPSLVDVLDEVVRFLEEGDMSLWGSFKKSAPHLF